MMRKLIALLALASTSAHAHGPITGQDLRMMALGAAFGFVAAIVCTCYVIARDEQQKGGE